MSDILIENMKLAELYGIDAQHAEDLNNQLEQIEVFEAAVEGTIEE